MKRTSLLLAVVGVFLPVLAMFFQGVASAQPPSLEEIAARLQRTYESTANFSAEFMQITTLSFNQRQRQATGLVTIEKGGRMRWEYLEPDPQMLVSDGSRFSMYVAKDQQMIVGDAKTYLESDITYAFLSGTGNIGRDFLLERPAGTPPAGNEHHLRLTPKMQHPQVDFLEIWVDSSSSLITRIKIVDHFGSITEIVFSNMRTNVVVPEHFYTFVPPKGTEIIEQ